MNKLLLFAILLFCFSGNAQQRISFTYDQAGNQTQRWYCEYCPARNSAPIINDVTALKEEDLQKFFENDVISYYPNPVKEFLYLKWELVNNNKVKSIQLHTLNGQLQKEIPNLENTQSQTVSFQNLPNGMYILTLLYTDGDQKTIKIVK